MKLDRIKEVEYYIAENKAVSLDKLCDTFNLFKNTIKTNQYIKTEVKL